MRFAPNLSLIIIVVAYLVCAPAFCLVAAPLFFVFLTYPLSPTTTIPPQPTKSTASSSGAGDTRSEEEKRADQRTKGWNDEQDPVSFWELSSWYLYDWANSVFCSAAVVMWLPVLLTVLATTYACPYTRNAPNSLTALQQEVIWAGFFYSSTTCAWD